MDSTSTELADALSAIEASPTVGALRLRAAVLANRLALTGRDAFHADVAEAIAEDDVPGATRALRESLREQSELARSIRRAIATGDAVQHPALPQEEPMSAAL